MNNDFLLLNIMALSSIVLFYVVGCLVLGVKIGSKCNLIGHLLCLFTGLLLVVAGYAVFKSLFQTVAITILIALIYFRGTIKNSIRKGDISLLEFSVFVVISFFFVSLAQVEFNFNVFSQPLSVVHKVHPLKAERMIYSTIVSNFYYYGLENTNLKLLAGNIKDLSTLNGITLYHYFEIWMASLYKEVNNINSELILYFLIYPVIKVITLISFISLGKSRISQVYLVIFAAIIWFIGVFQFSIPLSYQSVKLLIILNLYLLFINAWRNENIELCLFILIIAPVINIMLLPVSVLFLLALFAFRQINKKHLFIFSFFAFIFLLSFILNMASTNGDGVTNKFVEVFTSERIITMGGIVIRQIFKVHILFYLLVIIVLYYKKPKWSLRNRYLVYLLISLIMPFGRAFLSNFTVEAWQLTSLINMLVLVALIDLIEVLIREKKFIIATIFILAISTLTIVFNKQTHNVINERNDYSSLTSNPIVSKYLSNNHINGLYINEYDSLNSHHVANKYPFFIDTFMRINDFRFYLINYDLSGLQKSVLKLDPYYSRILYNQLNALYTEPLSSILANQDLIIIHSKSQYFNKIDGFVEIGKTGSGLLIMVNDNILK